MSNTPVDHARGVRCVGRHAAGVNRRIVLLSSTGVHGQSLRPRPRGAFRKARPSMNPKIRCPTSVMVTVAGLRGNIISSPRGSSATVAISPAQVGNTAKATAASGRFLEATVDGDFIVVTRQAGDSEQTWRIGCP